MPLLALLISIRDAFLTTYALLPSHLLKTLITNTQAFTHSSDHPGTQKIFIAEMEF